MHGAYLAARSQYGQQGQGTPGSGRAHSARSPVPSARRSLFDGGDAEMDDAPNAMAALASAAAVAANAMQQQQRSAPPAAGARSPTASVQFVRVSVCTILDALVSCRG